MKGAVRQGLLKVPMRDRPNCDFSYAGERLDIDSRYTSHCALVVFVKTCNYRFEKPIQTRC